MTWSARNVQSVQTQMHRTPNKEVGGGDMMGKEGAPITLLEHVVSDHGKSLSPENFTEFTLKVAGASPPPGPLA